jgi:hypothetical protein
MVDHASYRRNSFEPKIKGPDYDFLKDILYKTIATEEADCSDVSSLVKFKNKSRKLLAQFPVLYRCAKFISQKCRI